MGDDPTADPTVDPTKDPTADPTIDPTTDPTSPPSQTGLNEAFGTTGSGGASILSAIIIIVLLILCCALLVYMVYRRMNENMRQITKQMTEMMEEREVSRKQSMQSPASPDMSIDIGNAGASSNNNDAATPVDEGMNSDLTIPKGQTKMGHVASDESMIMADMMM